MDKPILCLDFDGVIHKYREGWQEGRIYDGMTDGFIEWALDAMKHFKLVVYSSRSKTAQGTKAMCDWFRKQLSGWYNTDDSYENDERYLRFLHAPTASVLVFYFTHEKPPAFLTIDDRCIRFVGDWNLLKPEGLRAFRPWMVPK